MASAQQPTPSRDSAAIAAAASSFRKPVDSAAVRAAAAIADTGRMIPGYRDLSRYNTPGYCLAALRGADNGTRRRNERSMIDPGASYDTVPAAVAAIGRACLARLPNVANTDPTELPSRLALAVALRDSAQLFSVLERQLSLAPTVEARGYVYHDAVEALIDPFNSLVAHPIDLSNTDLLLSRLDALGREARIPRLMTHALRRNFAESARFDTTALLREDNALRAVALELTQSEREEHENELAMTVADSVIVAWYRRVDSLPERVRGTVKRAITAVASPNSPIRNAMGPMVEWLGLLASQIGKPAPPLTAKYWFPSDAGAGRPTPGKVTLVMRTQKGAGLMDSQMAMLQRMHTKYAAKGLDIILVLKTDGFSWSSPPQSPADEAKTDAWYYLEFLKLPFTVAVDETPFTKQDDGRLVAGRINFEQQYVLPQVLIGRDGRIYTVWLGFESEAQLEAFIQQALAAPPSSPQG